MNEITFGDGEIAVLPAATRLVVLENGLTLIIREDHTAPVVSAQAWCKAGSIDEGVWLGGGLSHILEHMLFKGTATRAADRIDQEVQEAGGYMNAYTSFDRTVYWINVPNTGARVAADILGDIMQHASLPQEELLKEKQVILREMDMNHDDPGRRSSRRLFETAYTRSPYRYTIIGYPDVFHRVEREDVVGYYREKYTPNNIFFVVVGDFDAAEVENQLRQAFAGAKSRPLPPAVLPGEPPQTGPRELIEEAPVALGHLHFAWHIPDLRHADTPALDILATLLGAGHSSRLYQQVRERQGLTHACDAWTYNPGNPGLFGISAVVDAEKFEPAARALFVEVKRMQDELVSSEELAKAVKQFTAAMLATRKTMQGQAQDLGANWISAADLNFSERYLAAVKRAAPEDLRRVARTYLCAENRTLYALLPAGSAPRKTLVPDVLREHPIQKFELSNGLRLLIKEDRRLPFIHIHAVFKGGVLAESPEKNGVTLMLAKMLLKGTRSRSAEQIVTEIESLGGSIDSYAGNNSFGLSVEALSSDFQRGLELAADVLLHPAFPSANLERERVIQLASIRSQKDQMLQTATRAMRRALYGPRIYGLDIHGTEETVSRLNGADLSAAFDRWVRPNNAVLALFGDLAAPEALAAARALFETWPGGPPVCVEAVAHQLSGARTVAETLDKKQAVVVVGFPGVSVADPDRYPLELIQEALSDLGSRLFLRIRERLGLAYYVGAQNFLGLQPGHMAFYAGTEPARADQVLQELLQEARTLREEGLTAIELKRAKAKLVGQKKIARQDLASLAMTSALDELYGLGYNHSEEEDAKLEAVTLDHIRAAAEKYLDPERYVAAIVRPPASQ